MCVFQESRYILWNHKVRGKLSPDILAVELHRVSHLPSQRLRNGPDFGRPAYAWCRETVVACGLSGLNAPAAPANSSGCGRMPSCFF